MKSKEREILSKAKMKSSQMDMPASRLILSLGPSSLLTHLSFRLTIHFTFPKTSKDKRLSGCIYPQRSCQQPSIDRRWKFRPGFSNQPTTILCFRESFLSTFPVFSADQVFVCFVFLLLLLLSSVRKSS